MVEGGAAESKISLCLAPVELWGRGSVFPLFHLFWAGIGWLLQKRFLLLRYPFSGPLTRGNVVGFFLFVCFLICFILICAFLDWRLLFEK